MRFNPSFTGNAAMAYESYDPDEEILKFQSFFYWKCRNGQDETGLKYRAKLRFNPSFTGNAAMAFFGSPWHHCRVHVSILLLLEMPQWHAAANP